MLANLLTSHFYNFVVFIITLRQTFLTETFQLADFFKLHCVINKVPSLSVADLHLPSYTRFSK